MNRAVWFNVSPEGAKAVGTLHHFVTQGTALPSLLTHVSETHASDEAYAAALAVFGEKDLVDLTLTIATMNAINRMGVSFRMKPRAKA